MKNFRIAKCIDNNGIHEYAIFSDGSARKKIENNEKYGKFFYVDNELDPERPNYLRTSFRGRIKDAVETVRNGNGDCIATQDIMILGRRDRVVFFINREIGEELRKQFIEGWKDTEFAFAVECGNKNSFSGYSPINNKGERISVFDEDKTPKMFDTQDEAEEYIKGLISEAATYAKELAKNTAECGDDQDKISAVFNAYMEELKEKTGTEFSVIGEFVYDMLTDNMEFKSEELDEYGYKVIQCIANAN